MGFKNIRQRGRYHALLPAECRIFRIIEGPLTLHWSGDVTTLQHHHPPLGQQGGGGREVLVGKRRQRCGQLGQYGQSGHRGRLGVRDEDSAEQHLRAAGFTTARGDDGFFVPAVHSVGAPYSTPDEMTGVWSFFNVSGRLAFEGGGTGTFSVVHSR